MASEFASQLASALVTSVLLRLVTFTLSTWVTRKLLPSQMGTSFSYDVYVDAMVFVGREAVRCVASRYPVVREKDSNPRETKGLAIDRYRLVAMLNTFAIIIPACGLLMMVVELVGGFILPVGSASLSWMWSCWQLRHTSEGLAPFPISQMGETGWKSIIPSLTQKVWPSWSVGWEFVREAHAPLMNSSQGMSSIPFLASILTMASMLHITFRLLIPEILVWCCVMAMASVELSIGLFSALDLFRTTVLAEAFGVVGRQVATLCMIQFWLPLASQSSAFTAADLHSRCALAASPTRCEEVFQRMKMVDETWRIRVVFAIGLLTYGLSLVLFYAVACGKHWKRCRRWLGAARWEPPPALTAHLTEHRPSSSLESFFSVSRPMEEIEKTSVGIHEREERKTEKTKTKPAMKRNRSAFKRFGFLFVLSEYCSPLLYWYVDWPLVWGAFHYHRLLLQAFFKESLTRLALTEGTNFALFSLADASSRGCFQTISRLGALVIRLVFRVWENACLAHWSRLAQQGESGRREALRSLSHMLRISFYVGFFCSWLGPLYAELILQILYAGRWTTPGMVSALQYYCCSLGILAWNGLLECFVRTVSNPKLLKQQQIWSLIISGIYVVSSYVFLWEAGDRTGEAARSTLQGGDIDVQKNTCEGASALKTLLFLQRANMVARIFVSLGLVLWSSDALPSCRLKKEGSHADLSLRDRKDDALSTTNNERKELSSTETTCRPLFLLPLWRDVFVPFFSPSFIPLAAVYWWTRTPAFFPTAWMKKFYMPPLLVVLCALVIIVTDVDVRRSAWRIAERLVS